MKCCSKPPGGPLMARESRKTESLRTIRKVKPSVGALPPGPMPFGSGAEWTIIGNCRVSKGTIKTVVSDGPQSGGLSNVRYRFYCQAGNASISPEPNLWFPVVEGETVDVSTRPQNSISIRGDSPS